MLNHDLSFPLLERPKIWVCPYWLMAGSTVLLGYHGDRDTIRSGRGKWSQHRGDTCRGPEAGLHRRLRAEISQCQTGQVAEMCLHRGEPPGAAGLPGQSRAAEPIGVFNCRWDAPGCHLSLHLVTRNQGCVLHEVGKHRAHCGDHEGEVDLRTHALQAAGSLIRHR